MIDVLLLTVNDWANTGYRTAKCLRYLGLRVLGLKKMAHPFMYPEQLLVESELPYDKNKPVQDWKCLQHFATKAKVIHFMHSTIADFGCDLKPNGVIFQHGGQAYRINHKPINEILANMPHYTVVQMPDLMGLGAKNEHLIYFSVDTDLIQPDYHRRDNSKLIIGHFPTWDCKGTSKIVQVLKDLKEDHRYKDKFEYIGEHSTDRHRPWWTNLERLRYCDVIIDGMQETLDYGFKDKTFKYGEWGNTAFEAAALGKICITHSHSEEVYLREYGCEPQLAIANTPEQLRENLELLLHLDDNTILKMKKSARLWVEDKHSIRATAVRYWDKIYREVI